MTSNPDMEHKFIKELHEFFKFLNTISDATSLQNILKNFTHLNFKKISAFTYKSTMAFKVDIFKHNAELFIEPQVFFPTLDISPIYNAMNPDQVNEFWEKFVRIYVYCQCLNNTEQADNTLMDKLILEYQHQ